MVTTPNDNNDNNNIKGLLSGWGLSRPCESCTVTSALVYCRTDATFLCGSCVRIHITLADRHHHHHECVWVCEVCEQAPAVVTCKADAAALCAACDHDIHSANPLASRHERIPVTPIHDSSILSRSTTTTPNSSSFLVPDDLDSVPIPGPVSGSGPIDDPDTWLIPNPSSTLIYTDPDIINFGFGSHNLVKPTNNIIQEQQDTKPSIIIDENLINYAFTSDSVVPTQSQGTSNNNNNNNFITNSSTDFSFLENCFNIDFSQPTKLRKKNHNNNNNNFFNSSFNYSPHQSVSSSDIGVVPEGNTNSVTSEVSYSFSKSAASAAAIDAVTTTGAAPVMDREARVLRYREKRKNRKFEKTIRYASRKAYAETRPRVKGRFAKRTDQSETSEIDFSGIENGYGVVPAF